MAERKTKKPVRVTEASVRRWGASRRDFCPSDAFLFGHREPGFAPDEKRVDDAVSAQDKQQHEDDSGAGDNHA